MPPKATATPPADDAAQPEAEEMHLDPLPGDRFDCGITPWQLAMLERPLPLECVEDKIGSDGKRVNYVRYHWFVRRMNWIVGIGNWFPKVVDRGEPEYSDWNGTGDRKGQLGTQISVTCSVEVHVRLGSSGEWLVLPGIGTGIQTTYSNPAVQTGFARKAAVTDASKNAMLLLGDAFGLALKDPAGRFVTTADDPDNQEQHKGTATPRDQQSPAPAPRSNGSAVARSGEVPPSSEGPLHPDQAEFRDAGGLRMALSRLDVRLRNTNDIDQMIRAHGGFDKVKNLVDLTPVSMLKLYRYAWTIVQGGGDPRLSGPDNMEAARQAVADAAQVEASQTAAEQALGTDAAVFDVPEAPPAKRPPLDVPLTPQQVHDYRQAIAIMGGELGWEDVAIARYVDDPQDSTNLGLLRRYKELGELIAAHEEVQPDPQEGPDA